MTGRPNNVVEDWTYGPARWLGAGVLAGAAIVGMIWSISARRVDAQSPPAFVSGPAAKSAAKHDIRGETGPASEAKSVAKSESETPKPTQPAPIITQLQPREEAQTSIPPRPETKSETAKVPDAIAAPAKAVNINTALTDELERLPGIGPSLAARIVEDRAKNGRFKKIDDLDRVKGIGPKLLEKIRPFAAVE